MFVTQTQIAQRALTCPIRNSLLHSSRLLQLSSVRVPLNRWCPVVEIPSFRRIMSTEKERQDHIAAAKKERIALVDEHNRVIGEVARADMRRFRKLHRATFVLIINSKGKFIVQKRSAIKDYCPGWLDVSPGGCLGAGESYEENAQREMEEEMGIKGVSMPLLFTFRFTDQRADCWGGVFVCHADGPFTLQKTEVDCVYEMSREEIEARRAEFTPDGLKAFDLFLLWQRHFTGSTSFLPNVQQGNAAPQSRL
eukprot:g42585.t1